MHYILLYVLTDQKQLDYVYIIVRALKQVLFYFFRVNTKAAIFSVVW